MRNFIGANRELVIAKSAALRILLILSKKELLVSDVPYALSCLELINLDGSVTTSIKGINPLLIYRKIFLYSLHLLFDNRLIFIDKYFIFLTLDGKNVVDGLQTVESDELNAIFLKIKKLDISTDFRMKYIELTKEYDYVLHKRDFDSK